MEKEQHVLCNGKSSGSPGHPGVYLKIEGNGKAVCPYCSHVYTAESHLHKGKSQSYSTPLADVNE